MTACSNIGENAGDRELFVILSCSGLICFGPPLFAIIYAIREAVGEGIENFKHRNDPHSHSDPPMGY